MHATFDGLELFFCRRSHFDKETIKRAVGLATLMARV